MELEEKEWGRDWFKKKKKKGFYWEFIFLRGSWEGIWGMGRKKLEKWWAVKRRIKRKILKEVKNVNNGMLNLWDGKNQLWMEVKSMESQTLLLLSTTPCCLGKPMNPGGCSAEQRAAWEEGARRRGRWRIGWLRKCNRRDKFMFL